MDQLRLEDACRYVGALYLQYQQELDRQRAVYEARVRQLEADLEEARRDRPRA